MHFEHHDCKVSIYCAVLQNFFGTGYFLEGTKKPDKKYSYLRQLEKKQVLSSVEKLKLLSRLEKAGLTLSKVLLRA